MKRLVNKGELVLISTGSKNLNESIDMDIARELDIDDVFIWNPWKDNRPFPKFKVLSIDFPIIVEEIN